MRLTIVGINFAPEVTGVAPYTTAIANGLARRGHTVRVIAGLPHYPRWRVERGHTRDFETADGVVVHRVRHPVPASPTVGTRIGMEATFALGAITARWGRPDAVIAVSPALLGAAAAGARARAAGIPVGVVAQDIYSAGAAEVGAMHHAGRGPLRRLEQRTLTRADGVVVIHDRFVETLARVGIDTSAVTVIRNWTHVSAAAVAPRDTTRARRGWSPDEVVVVHAGNMGRKQALDSVVEAARLADHRRARVRFVLIGDGNQRAALQRLAQSVDRVEFATTLHEREYMSVLAAADVLLVNELPAVTEMALPSKITSYLAVGRPIVAATPTGSVAADEVRSSGAGVVVTPGDPAALLDALLSAGQDTTLARIAADRGPKRVQEVLGETEAIDAYEQWCTDLVAGRRPR
ncbi:MAG: glycosyltransferase family 4 protein [Gordonia polyisoprenivorans]|nr:glycosyltransferase family 4 protein [Gordonia polyisoprenivorans]